MFEADINLNQNINEIVIEKVEKKIENTTTTNNNNDNVEQQSIDCIDNTHVCAKNSNDLWGTFLINQTRNIDPILSDNLIKIQKNYEQDLVSSLKRKLNENENIENDNGSGVQTECVNNNTNNKKTKLSEEFVDIQNKKCFDLKIKTLSKCLDCSLSGSKNINVCRFIGWRKIKEKSINFKFKNFYSDYLTVDDIDIEDCALWSLDNHPNNESNELMMNVNNAKYIFKNIHKDLLRILSYEEQLKDQHGQKSSKIFWKRQMTKTRELCDQCNTTIFNVHFFCEICGFFVCPNCYDLRKSNQTLRDSNRNLINKNKDGNDWFYCTGKQKSQHLPDNLKAVQYIPPHSLRELKDNLVIYSEMYKETSPDEGECQLESSDNFDWFGGESKFLVIKNASNESSFEQFNKEWTNSHTVVIRNVHLNLDTNLWTPDSFTNDFGELNVDLMNCKNSKILHAVKMKDFWIGFENSELRLTDQKGDPMILKLKDWPSDDEFERVLPSRFNNLMDNLPIEEYTKRTSRFNLVHYLPDMFLKPDLGPKLYIAYSSFDTPRAGTTNLHVDISDAVNVMLYIGEDKSSVKKENHLKKRKNSCSSSYASSSSSSSSLSPCEQPDEILEFLKELNCDDKQIERYLNGEKLGAIWHIFLPSDADVIRSFLLNLDLQKGRPIVPNTDPIHDQTHYIDNQMLKKLKDDYDVDSFTIIQYLGDAVFIPAGAPHQVRNLKSCIKVAEDFVTPHGVKQCLLLTDQFRLLSDKHSNHEDKLQIKNIVYHSAKECLNSFRKNKLI